MPSKSPQVELPHLATTLLFVVVAFCVLAGTAMAHEDDHTADIVGSESHSSVNADNHQVAPADVDAACAGGPVIDGITLDECYIHNFNVNGDAKSIRVWYTQDTTEATRTVDGSDVTLQHWINTDAEAVQVAEWFEEAWIRFHTDSGHHLYDTGCSDRVNVQMEDGVGWSGIAYWASSGNCNIGIDSPLVRGGGGQRTVYHEAQHYLQYSYDNGCYADLMANYMSGTAPGNAEFTEGYADLGSDSVDATIDANYLLGTGYNPESSMYNKNYNNRFVKYLIEQLGSNGSPSDPWHNINAMYAHYNECDGQNTLYVLDDLIPVLSNSKWSMEGFFLNFFAANWAQGWADPATQPELVYLDDDGTGSSYNGAPLNKNVNMGSGDVETWSHTTPDTYAARYYRINPQAGCDYVQVEVDGQAGANLGINLMAAKTSSPTSVLRSARIGEDYVRLFAGADVHNRIVAVVNSFSNTYNYDVTFSCVNPTVNILEPKQTNFTLVGEPASPLTYLTRFEVTSSGVPVRGLVDSSFTFDAEGDAPTIVPGTFQQVGEEYWAVMQAPVKPGGTAFVDYEVCLAGGVLCDSETDALLYVPPGNSDIALTFDASGSMGAEDVIGEGTRLINAQRAGKVVADLGRVGDRMMVTDFSAKNIPANCGNTTQDCELDLRTLLPRSNVVGPATISAAKTAIDAITPRDWTPIGEALVDAKNKLVSAPFSENPKHIFLLSDGAENVKRLYAAVRTELIDSGVVINTIAFGPEADSSLMAQIAADTGGLFRPVPTTDSGSLLAASAADMEMLSAINAPEQMMEALAGPSLPGQLGLADVYDNFDTEAQDATRIFHVNHPGVLADVWHDDNWAIVDKSVNTLRFVVATKQGDHTSCSSGHRDVEVWNGPADSDPQEPRKEWIPISPVIKNNLPPANWSVRNSTYDDVLIVTNPDPGLWRYRVRYRPGVVCAADESSVDAPDIADAGITDIMMNMSVQSTIKLEGRILGLTDNRGEVGDVVSIVATVLDKTGPMTDVIILGLVQPEVGAPEIIALRDDGMHNDGQAKDGIFGWNYTKTYQGGAYNVRLVTGFDDPNDPASDLRREWNGGFWLEGIDRELDPDPKDPDRDGMPTAWEERCGLDPKVNDAKLDPDKDTLPSGREFILGTLPCVADTDHGGEHDGSEVDGGRNPLWPNDDKVRPIRVTFVRPLNAQVLLTVRKPFEYTKFWIYVSTDPDEPGKPTEVKPDETIVLNDLDNDQTYHIWVQGETADGKGDLSERQTVTPKADPDPPAGILLIDNGAPVASSKKVVLYMTATDEPLPGMAEGANAHMTDHLSDAINEVSGNLEMRVGNSEDLSGAAWEPFAAKKDWTMACNGGEVCTVYAQFRDGAGNESLVTADSILLDSAATCHVLTRTHTGDGADPVATPANSDGCASGGYVAGASISLKANPAAGTEVKGWSGTSNDASSGDANFLTMPANSHTVGVKYGQGSSATDKIYLPTVRK